MMANYWTHNGFLQVEGEKMSKSLGNFVTIRELLENWKGYGWPGEALRFNMLRTHYRQPIDWTYQGLDDAHKTLWGWYGDLTTGLRGETEIPSALLDALCDDLNTPIAIKVLHDLHRKRSFAELRLALTFLGFSCDRDKLSRIANAVGTAAGASYVFGVGSTKEKDELIIDLVAARSAARKAKDFKESDRIRDELAKMGVVLKDGKDPATGEPVTTWEIAR